MPWTSTNSYKERYRFVQEHETGLWTMLELCERFGVSRKTGYKILGRYEEQGDDGLKDQSRAPQSCPHKMAPAVEKALLALKKRYPRFGARKLRVRLSLQYPKLPLPARRAIT